MAQLRSRREQVEAHKFTTTRMNLALLLGSPDSLERPMRRIGVSILASVAIMAVILGIFVIVAMLDKGRDEPQLGSIIIDKESNTVYVYMKPPESVDTEEEGGLLFEVQNYTSALLMVEDTGGQPNVQRLKPESFSHIPRGWQVGIVGAPSSPPTEDQILKNSDWNLCNMPARPDTDTSLLQLGIKDLPEPDTWIDGQDWLVVRSAEERLFLIANGLRHEIVDPETIGGLHINEDNIVEVREHWIDAVEAGPDLEHPDVPSLSKDSGVEVDGAELKFGSVVTSDDNYYALVPDGSGGATFAPIGAVSQALLASEYAFGEASEISRATLTDLGTDGEVEKAGMPQELGEAVKLDGGQPAVCGIFSPGEDVEEQRINIGVFERAPETLREAADNLATDEFNGELPNGAPANLVIEGSKAVLAMETQLPGQTLKSNTFLIDEIGVKYGLVDSEGIAGGTMSRLGYDESMVTEVPDVYLNLINNGADLDPVEARRQINPTLSSDDFNSELNQQDDNDD
ncbi:type VII secretion protein EccB [Haloglycomyces albus]|uniref:type VII secretion protein EccB n=1 Tax=Haloglycomyces albus TaxID=526067 RepID=UPI00046D1F77|nr:type VII secretion protein EccB [Haloglycomyces albus]